MIDTDIKWRILLLVVVPFLLFTFCRVHLDSIAHQACHSSACWLARGHILMITTLNLEVYSWYTWTWWTFPVTPAAWTGCGWIAVKAGLWGISLARRSKAHSPRTLLGLRMGRNHYNWYFQLNSNILLSLIFVQLRISWWRTDRTCGVFIYTLLVHPEKLDFKLSWFPPWSNWKKSTIRLWKFAKCLTWWVPAFHHCSTKSKLVFHEVYLTLHYKGQVLSHVTFDTKFLPLNFWTIKISNLLTTKLNWSSCHNPDSCFGGKSHTRI